MPFNKSFDLVVSLGGNCAAAHQLKYKNFRTKSYPFDWTYFTSDEAVYKLITGFKENFKNYALKKNFKELPVNPSHPDRIQYKDNYGEIIWANHFSYNKNKNSDYEQVKEKLDRRFKRLVDSIKEAKRILFIFSVSFKISPDAFLKLIDTLYTIYPDKHFEIKVLSFDASKNSVFKNKDVEIFYYRRLINNQDFDTTNKEWDFLNHINKYQRFINGTKKNILRHIIDFIPKKSLKKRLKQKYHI